MTGRDEAGDDRRKVRYMNTEIIRGVIPPIVTPLDRKENVDETGLRAMVNHCIDNGLHGIYVTGSAGETMSLMPEQRSKAIKIVIEETKGRVPVYCGVMDASTRRVVENLKELEQAGGQIAVVTPPFYIRNSGQQEIIRHFETAAASTALKIMVYNIPGNTQVNILPETVVRLAGIDNIVGIKESSGNWQQFQKCLQALKGSGFAIIQGLPELAAASLIMGADGITPVYSVLLPRIYRRLYESARKRDVDAAFEFQRMASAINEVNKLGTSYVSIQKYVTSLTGLMAKQTAMPCEPLKPEEEEAIARFMQPFMETESRLHSEEMRNEAQGAEGSS